LLGVGVLIGSGLHTRSIDREYRRLAWRSASDTQRARDGTGQEALPHRDLRVPAVSNADVEWPGGSVTASAVCALHTTIRGQSAYAPSCG